MNRRGLMTAALSMIALLGLLATAASAAAQAPATESRQSQPGTYEDCVRLSQVLINGRQDPGWKQALRGGRFCDVTGHLMLADAWRRARDSASAEDLYRAFDGWREGRVVPTLTAIAEDERAPRWKRLFAMHTLLKYLRPRYEYEPVGGMGIALADLYAPAITPSARASARPAALEATDTAARPISRMLLRVAGTTRDPMVRSTARGLGTVAHVDAIAGGAPDTLAKDLLAALPAARDCRPVLTGLVQPRRDARWERAIAEVEQCPEIAAIGLGRAWRGVGEDSTLLRDLQAVSRRYPDARLYATVLEVAGDPQAGVRRRLAALDVIGEHEMYDRFRRGVRPPEVWQWLPTDHAARTSALLRRLAAEDPSEEVKSAARALEAQLRPR